MGVRRVTRTRRALVGLLLGALALTAGAALAWGPGYGALILGALLIAYFLVIYDVDEADAEDL